MSQDKIVQQIDEEIIIAIIGSRSFKTFEHLTIMDTFIREKLGCVSKVNTVVSGAAAGADTLGKMWANVNGCDMVEFPADWNTYGKAAGFIRNKTIIEAADVVFAFWDGKSKGTKHSIKIAKEMKKELHICFFEDKDNNI